MLTSDSIFSEICLILSTVALVTVMQSTMDFSSRTLPLTCPLTILLFNETVLSCAHFGATMGSKDSVSASADTTDSASVWGFSTGSLSVDIALLVAMMKKSPNH